MRNPSLVAELCRIFHAKPVAIECAIRHKQVSVDGYTIGPQHDRRWPEDRLSGRMAELLGRQHRLFDGATEIRPARSE